MRKKKMTEDALMTVLAERACVEPSEAAKVWDALRNHIRDGVNGHLGEPFYVPGLGTFTRAVHKGHPLNLKIKDGKERIEDYEVVRFKADQSFKDIVLVQMK